jgi:hypothetical protein
MTIEAWVKFDTIPSPGEWQTIVFKPASASNLAYALYYHNGITFEIRSGSTNIAAEDHTAIAPAAWHHIAAVYDRVSIRVYIDGVLAETVPFTAAVVTSNLPLTIGDNNVWGNEQLGATLDEVRLSNSSRYSGNFTPTKRFAPDGNTIALYHFDEVSGQTGADASSSGNTLTLGTSTATESSDPTWVTGAPQVFAGGGIGGSFALASLPSGSAGGRGHERRELIVHTPRRFLAS